MLRVGLTGGMGSGKSMVAARLAQCGASIIDSDRIAREVVSPGTDGLRAVIREFGEKMLAADGSLDRSALAARVFRDAGARARLNAIVHPLVAARSAELVAAGPAEAIVVQDIPLLVEVRMAAAYALRPARRSRRSHRQHPPVALMHLSASTIFRSPSSQRLKRLLSLCGFAGVTGSRGISNPPPA